MYVTQVELIDFRNYEHASLQFTPGANLVIGPNGHGKTNIVEAIAYLATLTSHRVASDAPLVRAGAAQAVVRAKVVAGLDDPRTLTLELEINPGRANRARLNRAPQRRARDLVGALRVVTFTPDDLAIVKGDPAQRRDALDDIVVQRWPRLAGVQADYDKVVRQRNALLRSVANWGGRLDFETTVTLDIWDDQLARFGAEIMVARARTALDMRPNLADAYQAIAPANNQATLAYAPRQDDLRAILGADETPPPATVADALREALRARRVDEVRRGICLVGPHRDDIELTIGALPAKGYASHGEAWSLALSWRLAGFALLRQDGSQPVLILDDVFAELDATRRDRLAGAVGDAEQVLITAAVEDDVPTSLRGNHIKVHSGTVQAASCTMPLDER